MCRDVATQAVLPLRGKVLNTHDKELADIIKNKEVKDMITSFGTGINDQFNIHNLRYKRIIILADAK
jgi:DNA gyrase subunit B